MNKKLPIGALALCFAAALGARDSGVFINEHVQTTYSGNKVYFELAERADILEEVSGGYLVKKGQARVTVPKEKVLVTEAKSTTYTVKSPTTLKDNSGKIIRNLFVGELVTEISTDDNTAFVKTSDGEKGSVIKSALTLKDESVKRNITSATVRIATKALSDRGSYDLKVGDKVNIVDYKKGLFVIDIAGTNYNVYESAISLKSGETINFTERDIRNDEQEIQNVATRAANEENVKSDINDLSFGTKEATPAARRAVELALDKLGSPYVYGSKGNGSYDCSGLIYAVYNDTLNINIPRSSSELSKFGTQLDRSELAPGDLIFFATGSTSAVSHVGMYLGDGKFVHASSGKGKVVISSLSEDYYNSRYVNATRVAR